MKKFKFKLQSVLDKRQKELEEKQLEMSEVQTRKKQQEDLLQQITKKREQTLDALDNIIGERGSVDIFIIKNHQNFIDKLGEDTLLQMKLIDDIQQELELKQKEVQDALKAKMMLENLKEKHYKEFLDEFETHQANELDDITSARFKLDKKKAN